MEIEGSNAWRQRNENNENEENFIIGSSDKMASGAHRIPSIRPRKYRLDIMVNKLYFLLEPIDKQEWTRWLPEFPTIPKLISRLADLSKESHHKRLVVDDNDNYWDTVAARYDVLAQEVVGLAEFVGLGGQRVIDC